MATEIVNIFREEKKVRGKKADQSLNHQKPNILVSARQSVIAGILILDKTQKGWSKKKKDGNG